MKSLVEAFNKSGDELGSAKTITEFFDCLDKEFADTILWDTDSQLAQAKWKGEFQYVMETFKETYEIKPGMMPKENELSYNSVAGMYIFNSLCLCVHNYKKIKDFDVKDQQGFDLLLELLHKEEPELFVIVIVFYYLINPEFLKNKDYLDESIMNKYYHLSWSCVAVGMGKIAEGERGTVK